MTSDETGATHELSLTNYAGIQHWQPSDQVVIVRAGTSLGELQRELSTKGQCLPIVTWYDGWSTTNFLTPGTIGGAIAMNLPHELCSECGNWRDWVLGITVVLADGTIARSGSNAVKSVAGYDLHKLLIGARGTLGIICDVILQTIPIATLPEPKASMIYDNVQRFEYWWLQRVQFSDYADLQRNATPFGRIELPNSSTIFCELPPEQELPRYPGDWVVRTGCGEKNVQITDPTQIRFMKRAKQIFDPTGKLNPGEFGFL